MPLIVAEDPTGGVGLNQSPSPLAGVAETELQSFPIGEERSIAENGQT